MSEFKTGLTRRDFIKTTGAVALGAAMGLPALAQDTGEETRKKSKVVLVRHPDVIDTEGKINAEIIGQMLDDAMMALYGHDDPLACWKELFVPEDIVGIKTNVWKYLRTPLELEAAMTRRLMEVGIAEDKIGVNDRSILDDPIFKNSTALINTRPMRTHAWSGVGSLIKNYIMFVPFPQNYHGNACANLGAVWSMPMCKDKTRLNVLVMLTPLFYGVGPHHFDSTYVWGYHGLIVSADPVAADTVGLKIFQAKRKEYFGEDTPMKPTAHHIAFADTKFGLGVSDMDRIELVKLGWEEGVLV